jgi:DNA repair photolyase
VTLPEPRVHARQVRRALRKSSLIDSFLCCRFSFSPYMACGHGCRYCDGRAEKYWVEGDFERDIVVRENLPELLRAELAGLRERAPVGIGSGITDSYQPVERASRLTRECAGILAEHRVPVRLLTKSALVARDLDIWSRVNAGSSFILHMSIATLDEKVRQRFEPGASSIAERLGTLRAFHEAGIPVGVMAIPLLPFIADGEEDIRDLVHALKDAGASFVIPAGLTLRPGRQKDLFMKELAEGYPLLVEPYRETYGEERASGAATRVYRDALARRIRSAMAGQDVPSLLPHRLYRGSVPLYDEVHLLLQHMVELYAERGVETGRLKAACGRYGDWLLARKRIFNRRPRLLQEDVEEETRALFSTGEADGILANEKLAGFLADVVLHHRVLDYTTLTLSPETRAS